SNQIETRSNRNFPIPVRIQKKSAGRTGAIRISETKDTKAIRKGAPETAARSPLSVDLLIAWDRLTTP
ncbi:hypothetical protein, partial [Brucella sp. BO2]|uniref:hypothetical protein n=1 Tax=Brucella sp. BO2 TaxID=693750 RepID=UPI001AEBF50F